MRKYGESETTRILMATVPHVTSGLGLRKFQADGFLLMSSTFSSPCILHNYNRSKNTIGAALRALTKNNSRTHSWYVQSRWMFCVTVTMYSFSSRKLIQTHMQIHSYVARYVFFILALDNHKPSFEHKHNCFIEEFLITWWSSFGFTHRVLDGLFEVSEVSSASIFHLNQHHSQWRWKQYVPQNQWNTHIPHGIGTQYKTIK